jgi:hypothetical protein
MRKDLTRLARIQAVILLSAGYYSAAWDYLF